MRLDERGTTYEAPTLDRQIELVLASYTFNEYEELISAERRVTVWAALHDTDPEILEVSAGLRAANEKTYIIRDGGYRAADPDIHTDDTVENLLRFEADGRTFNVKEIEQPPGARWRNRYQLLHGVGE